MVPFWLSAFLDLPAPVHERTAHFWQGVTGFALSPSRGEHAEFATLVPPDGDDYLRVQRIASGPARVHLDLSVTDPRAAADRAVGLGAHEIAAVGSSGERAEQDGHVVLRSPGGLTFCYVSHGGAARPTPVAWPAGHSSMVYQVCLDLPGSRYDSEAAFWASVLSGVPELLHRRPEFSWLRPRRQLALDVLLQRLDRGAGEVSAHLDLGTRDRAGEVARHLALGAELVVEEEFWSVLRDPAGLVYCVTDRDAETGRLAGSTGNPT